MLQFFAALRGPSRIKELQLQFFVALRGPSRPFVDKGVAVAVLSVSSRPFADKGVAVAVLPAPPWFKKMFPPPLPCNPKPKSNKIAPKTPNFRVIIPIQHRCSTPALNNISTTIAGPQAAPPEQPAYEVP